jgi:hypothetical protein
VQHFSLKEEFAKGEHMYDIVSLFPPNAAYAKLLSYHTPYNTPILNLLLAGAFFVYALTLVINGIALLRRKAENKKFAWSMVGLSIAALPLLVKMILDPGIFYFEFPYDGVGNLYNYLPLIMMVLAGSATYQLFRSPHKKALALPLPPSPITLPLFHSPLHSA